MIDAETEPPHVSTRHVSNTPRSYAHTQSLHYFLCAYPRPPPPFLSAVFSLCALHTETKSKSQELTGFTLTVASSSKTQVCHRPHVMPTAVLPVPRFTAGKLSPISPTCTHNTHNTHNTHVHAHTTGNMITENAIKHGSIQQVTHSTYTTLHHTTPQ